MSLYLTRDNFGYDLYTVEPIKNGTVWQSNNKNRVFSSKQQSDIPGMPKLKIGGIIKLKSIEFKEEK